MGFGCRSLEYFFEWFYHWDSHISHLDLTYGHELLKEAKSNIIRLLLTSDKKLMKLVLSNNNLEGDEIRSIFILINQYKQLFALDLSNINSLNLNRFGSEMQAL